MKKLISVFAVGSSICGCASVPGIPVDYAVTVADVVNHVRCELSELRTEPLITREALGWTAGINLSLVTFNSTTGTLQASLTSPISPGTGMLVATAGGSVVSSAKTTSALQFQKFITKIGPQCGSPVDDLEPGGITGDLGITRWFEAMQTALAESKVEDPKQLSYTVEFVVTANGSLGPQFSLLPVKASLAGVGGGLAGNKQHTHVLTLALSKTQLPTPLKVQIVSNKQPTGKVDKNNLDYLNNLLLQQNIDN